MHILHLAQGDPDPSRSEESQPWREVLNRVEEAADSQQGRLELSSIQGMVEQDTSKGSMVELVGDLLSGQS